MADRKNNLRMSAAAALSSGHRGPSSQSGTRAKPNVTSSIDARKVRIKKNKS
jgi:hypothetical protein